MSAKTKTKTWRELIGQEINYVIPPKIQALMSGVQRATQNNKGVITLVYTDNTTESANLPDFEMIEQEFFSIVSIVQEQRGMKEVNQ